MDPFIRGLMTETIGIHSGSSLIEFEVVAVRKLGKRCLYARRDLPAAAGPSTDIPPLPFSPVKFSGRATMRSTGATNCRDACPILKTPFAPAHFTQRSYLTGNRSPDAQI